MSVQYDSWCRLQILNCHGHGKLLNMFYSVNMCVTLMDRNLWETDTLTVAFLDKLVCEFDLLQPIRDSCSCCGYPGSESMWIWFITDHWRLTFLLWLSCISWYVNLIYYSPLETYILAVVVLDQDVCEFDLLQPIEDWHSCYGCPGSVCMLTQLL